MIFEFFELCEILSDDENLNAWMVKSMRIWESTNEYFEWKLQSLIDAWHIAVECGHNRATVRATPRLNGMKTWVFEHRMCVLVNVLLWVGTSRWTRQMRRVKWVEFVNRLRWTILNFYFDCNIIIIFFDLPSRDAEWVRQKLTARWHVMTWTAWFSWIWQWMIPLFLRIESQW